MRLSILSVGHPLAPVCLDAVGGAEQVLAQIDRALSREGHESFVIAPVGSKVCGRLLEIPAQHATIEASVLERAESCIREAITSVLSDYRVDLVHIHAVNFAPLIPESLARTLVTLHLPRSYYNRHELVLPRPNVWMHCVSGAQQETFSDVPRLLPSIENGVEVDGEPPYRGPRSYALWLGRICPEKATHLAIDACERAAVPIKIAGRAFPYPAHIDYFRLLIAPRLKGACTYVGSISGERKRQLLRRARCVIVTSLVPETSSLAAREALAAGTPVVALRSPALNELIENGLNGFLVDRPDELPAALHDSSRIDPEQCRRTAEQRCALSRMTEQYLRLYQMLAEHPIWVPSSHGFEIPNSRHQRACGA